MKIGIIGTGNIGSALTRRLTTLGYDVWIANSRGPQSLADLARETGAHPATVAEAARAGAVTIVTIPQKNIPDLPGDLFAGVPDDVVIVDTGNYYPQQRDGALDGIEDAPSESSWVAHRLGRPVVKAFNNIQAQHLLEHGKAAGTPGRIALPIAGDDPTAKAIVARIVDDLGFDVADVGGLGESWRQQPGTPVYGADLDLAGTRAALAAAKPGRTPEWRVADATARATPR